MATQTEVKDLTPIENAYDGESSSLEGQVQTGKPEDAVDMSRLGKKQEFKRNFGLLSTLGFLCTYMATWEYVLVSLAVGLYNGGFAGLFWTFLGTVLFYSTVVASLAEMESMAPTSGGQYHWVSEFAPEGCQKFLSYSAGWMSTLGWLASNASGIFVVTTLIQSLIEVEQTEYAFTNWQYTLIMLAFLVLTIAFNTWGAPVLPAVEIVGLAFHVLGFFVIIIPLLVMCPKNSASDVFATFIDGGEWGNIGVACLVSQATVLYCNLGSDSVVHISEEVKNASLTVPRVMWWSYVMNVIMGIAMLLVMVFCIGSYDDAVAAEAPYLQLFMNTGSPAVAYVLLIVLTLLIFIGNITALATTSRETFAFARDRGLPFSGWLSKINRKIHIPFNAVYAVSFWSAVLCLINLGSTFAFNICISLSLLALVSTYMLSIGSLCLKRFKGEPLPPARWSLGKLGLPINCLAFVYCGFVIIFSCFPGGLPVDLGSANWAPLVWVGVIILSVGTYILHGKSHFTAPVIYIEGRRVGGLQESG